MEASSELFIWKKKKKKKRKRWLNRNKFERLKGTNASNASKSWQNESWWYYREGVAARMHVSRFMARPSLYMQTGHAWKVCGRRHVHWTWLIAYKRHCKSRRYNVCFCHRGARAATAHRDTWRSLKRCLGWCTSFLSLFLSIQREIKLVALVPIKFQQDNLSKFLFLSLSLSDDFLFNIGIVIFSLLLFSFSILFRRIKSCHVRKRTMLLRLTSRIWRRFGWNYAENYRSNFRC